MAKKARVGRSLIYVGWERQHMSGEVSPLAKTRTTSWPAWPRVAGLLLIFMAVCQKPETRQELLAISQESKVLIQKAKAAVTAWPGECSVTE